MLELLYDECDARMRQEIKCSMLLSLRVQICLLSSVEFLCLAWRNDAVWFLYLVLKSLYFALLPCIEHCFTNIKFTLYVCMYVCMDGWMDGWMDVCMYVCMHACINFSRRVTGPSPLT